LRLRSTVVSLFGLVWTACGSETVGPSSAAPRTDISGTADAGSDSRWDADDTGTPDAEASADPAPDAAPDATTLDTAGDPDPDLAERPDAGTGEPDVVDLGAREPPTFEHLGALVDIFRGSAPTWLSFLYVTGPDEAPEFHWAAYGNTGRRVDFWPASTIKIYTATAALELLAEYGYSLDAEASFYHRAGPDSSWVLDTTRTFRAILFAVFDFSSNSDYTLLLRFAGVDWLNESFFTRDNGFNATALMRGYVTSRPSLYRLSEEQRIVIAEDGNSIERIHSWSGTTYATETGCTIYNDSGTGNCSSPNDMVEHMRRLIFHEVLPESERFDVRVSDLDWLRYGAEEPVLNDWESSWADGIFNVMPDADYYHKAGRVTNYALDLHYVDDAASDTRYAAAIVTESTATAAYQKLSEEIARMAMTPYSYVHLDYLADYVNPIAADLMVYSAEPGVLALIVKDYDDDPDLEEGWAVLAGTETEIEAGIHELSIESDCLGADDRVHIRGRFTPDAEDLPIAYSDRHFVIVDADIVCP
jgi:hypothetical protein